MTESENDLHALILQHIPDDGSSISKKALLASLKQTADSRFTEEDFLRARDELIAEGLLATGRGRGGPVMRPQAPSDDAATQNDNVLVLEMQEPADPSTAPARRLRKTASQPRSKKNEGKQVISYRYGDKRKNNPHVGMVDTTSDGVEGETTWAYDPHLDPALNFDSARAGIENLIDDALASGDEAVMRQALEQLKRMQAPYLNWTGKAERTSFEVDTVSLHVHERIDPATILAAIQKGMKVAKGKSRVEFQLGLFSAPFENLPLREAIDFYKHDRDWANRLIAGDSLLVMNSLLQKESMAGQVQMIYIDPPYGIKYGSNFQPFVNKRDVKDRSDDDLTQEPEMIKAFRDTWELGIHSYLTYLRDRLLLVKELLGESGSVFVQISDENLHRVRQLMDEVLGTENFVAIISYVTTSGFPSTKLSRAGDYIIWYGKNVTNLKYNQLFLSKEVGDEGAGEYKWLKMVDGTTRPLDTSEMAGAKPLPAGARIWRYGPLTSSGTSEEGSREFSFHGKQYAPSSNNHWKVTRKGLDRLSRSNFLNSRENSLSYYLFADFYPVQPINNIWSDTKWGFDAGEKVTWSRPIRRLSNAASS